MEDNCIYMTSVVMNILTGGSSPC